MPFLYLVEGIIFTIIVLGSLTQIIIPLAKGKKVFPIFRSDRAARLQEELEKAQQELEVQRLEGELQKKHNEALQQLLENCGQLDETVRISPTTEKPRVQSVPNRLPRGGAETQTN